jgi:SPP1 family predicted phage head-tail adaptor
MKDRLMIQAVSSYAVNSYGENIPVYMDIEEIWAEVRDLTMTEIFKAGQLYADANKVIRCRHHNDVKPDARLVASNGQTYNIRSIIDPNSKAAEMQLLCSYKAT